MQGRLCRGREGVDAGVRGQHGDEGGACVQTQAGNASSGHWVPQGSAARKSFESAEMKG